MHGIASPRCLKFVGLSAFVLVLKVHEFKLFHLESL